MRILGIDPGLVVMGYALLEGRELSAWGRFKGKGTWEERLFQGAQFVEGKIDELSPDEVAIEAPFTGANPSSAIKLAHLKGALMYVVWKKGIPVYEYSPRQVKKAITGRGNASKQEVRNFVGRIFRQVSGYDEADAVALAFTHYLMRER